MADKKNLLLLFKNPGEPVFTPKGKNNAFFDVPEKFLDEQYQDIDIQSRYGDDAGERIVVKDIPLPNLKSIDYSELGRDENLSLFLPKHQKIASTLIDIFMKAPDIDHLQSLAVYAREHVNAQLFNYALSLTLLHRPDTKGLDIPLFVENFPALFLGSRVLFRARAEANVNPKESRKPIIVPIDFTASDIEPEHRLWYFREDIGVNLHHWHWHLVYPIDAPNMEMFRKDRRGELFYYMHQQVIARYNFERFSNHLAGVVPLADYRKPIPEGYFSKLDSINATRSWPARSSNVPLHDLNRASDGVIMELRTLERWHDNILNAINENSVRLPNGEFRELDEFSGIDDLGNLVEASALTLNKELYGSIHNMGHNVISFQHDPDQRHLESFGVMGHTATAMRDPVFFRWHKHVDDIFNTYKEKLRAYTAQELTFPGIDVTGLQIKLKGGQTNKFATHWQQSDVDLENGMDFFPRGGIYARFIHLQHTPYEINIQVNNSSSPRIGMVRVFLAPKFDESGTPLMFREQRRHMVEIDKFVANLKTGENVINRESIKSSVTIPDERVFGNRRSDANFDFCGCGWPHHMLIPKGTTQGLACVLFVMISDYEQDRVDQDSTGSCNDAASYCGIRDLLYPDKRNMGYPFDRLPGQGAENLMSFLTPNMRTQDVTIVFNDHIVSSKE